MIASGERLMEVEQYEDADESGLRSMEEVWKLYEEQIREIAFEHVSFRYPGKDGAVLRDVSFSIAKGDSVAVTGTSGCGKSTMLKLLMGIYRLQTGTIQVILNDGTGIAIEDMKRLFAYVPQGNFLMGGSVRDVITFGQKRIIDGKLKRAVHLACADFVYDLPMQLDTILEEREQGSRKVRCSGSPLQGHCMRIVRY